MSRAVFAPSALLPDGWADNVRLELDAQGVISGVRVGVTADGAESCGGPVVPGMPNVHSHAFQRAMAGLTESSGPQGDNFWSWRECMYRFLVRLTPDDHEAIAAQLYVEMLESGYTSVGEFHYLHHDADGTAYADPAEMSRRTIEAASAAGIGLTLLPVLYRHGGFGGEAPSSGQRRFLCDHDTYAAIARAVARDARCTLGFAPHSLRAVSPADIAWLMDLRGELAPAAPVHIHAAEQLGEVDDCLFWSGLRPIEWLMWNTPLDAAWCIVHATHMREPEAAALGSRGAVVGLCPTTEADLGDGLFNAEPYRLAGGRIGIGGDSHVGTDPFAELRLFEYGQRLVRRRRNIHADAPGQSIGANLYRSALAGGAQALGQPVGGIGVGRRADLVVLDEADAALAGMRGDRLLDAAVFGPVRRPVRNVMVAGQWRVRDGRHVDGDRHRERYLGVMRRLLN